MSADTPHTDPASDPSRHHKRLGRGLASLMANTKTPSDHPSTAATQLGEPPVDARYQPVSVGILSRQTHADSEGPAAIPVSRIQPNPYQPRQDFDQSQLEELTASIRAQGMLQPLLVSRHGDDNEGQYLLIAGERRLRAARDAGLATVPCVVRSATREQMLEWALIENIQRRDLNPVETAGAYRDYMDRFSATQQQLADKIGQPRSTIANHLRLLELYGAVQELLANGVLSFGHGKVLASLAGSQQLQLRIAQRAVAQHLSVRHVEELVAEALTSMAGEGTGQRPPSRPPASGKAQYALDLERQISQAIGTKVTIRPGKAKNRGRIIIEYYSLDDFDRITEALGARLES